MKVEDIEEVPYPPQIQLPPIEEVILPGAMNVVRHQTPNGQLTLLQMITPFKVYTFKLDDNAATKLSDGVRPSGLVRATPGDLPK